MKKIITFAAILAITTIVSMPNSAKAQGPGFGNDVDDGGAPCTPLDGGLSVLLVAGVGYWAKKLHDSKETNS